MQNKNKNKIFKIWARKNLLIINGKKRVENKKANYKLICCWDKLTHRLTNCELENYNLCEIYFAVRYRTAMTSMLLLLLLTLFKSTSVRWLYPSSFHHQPPLHPALPFQKLSFIKKKLNWQRLITLSGGPSLHLSFQKYSMF